MIAGQAKKLENILREMRTYKTKRVSKYLDKFASLGMISKDDANTLAYVLDMTNTPWESEEEKTPIKAYIRFLVDAAFYGFKVDATYWAYYCLLKDNRK